MKLGDFEGYNPLLIRITEFFNTGIAPVSPEETLNLFAFMQAADESKLKGGVPEEIDKIMEKAVQRAKNTFLNECVKFNN